MPVYIKKSVLAVALALVAPVPARTEEATPSLDLGYQLMYNLQFESAQQQFTQWQQVYPQDPLGPASEAANHLFIEFERLGVLEAQFFTKDSSFRAKTELEPDADRRDRFEAALTQAQTMAQRRLDADDREPDALFALALVHGLRADYAALIEKRNLAALHETRQASEIASRLLAVAPDYRDAYLSTGIAKYIIGSLSLPQRLILRLAGYSGDRDKGMQELQLAARGGRYLAPFARIMLAIAYLRQENLTEARRLLAGLRDEFPSNPLFAKEVARIDERVK